MKVDDTGNRNDSSFPIPIYRNELTELKDMISSLKVAQSSLSPPSSPSSQSPLSLSPSLTVEQVMPVMADWTSGGRLS